MTKIPVQEDAWYYIEPDVEPFEKSRIRAACEECAKKKKSELKFMYWPGKTKGYGEWDIYCTICNKALYLSSA